MSSLLTQLKVFTFISLLLVKVFLPLAWALKPPVRRLLSTKPIEETLSLPLLWKIIVDAGINSDNYNHSRECSTALKKYATALSNREPWAIRIFDSSGKPGPGLMLGGLTQHGNYDECLNVKQYPELQQRDPSQVMGTHFCSAFYSVPVWLEEFFNSLGVPFSPKLSGVTVDLCMPVSCTTRDLGHILTANLSSSLFNVSIEEVECFQPPDFTTDYWAIILVTIFLIILFLTILATSLDVLQRLQRAEVISGEVTRIGYQKRMSRLSRLSNSLKYQWKKIGNIGDISEERTNSMDSKTNLLQRLSGSIIRRRASSPNTGETAYSARRRISLFNRLSRRKHAVMGEMNLENGGLSNAGFLSNDVNDAQLKSVTVISSNSLENKDDKTTAPHESTASHDSRSRSVSFGTADDEGSGSRMKNDKPHQSDASGPEPMATSCVNDVNFSPPKQSGCNSVTESPKSVETDISIHDGFRNCYPVESDIHEGNKGHHDNSCPKSAGSGTSENPDKDSTSTSQGEVQQTNEFDKENLAIIRGQDKSNPSLVSGASENQTNLTEDKCNQNSLLGCPSEIRNGNAVKAGTAGVITDKEGAPGDFTHSLADKADHSLERTASVCESTVGSNVSDGVAVPKYCVTTTNIGSVEGKDVHKEDGCLVKILLCFSFLRSIRQVIVEGHADYLFCLNGIRVLSIWWIVFGNSASQLDAVPAAVANSVDSVKTAQEFWFQAPLNGTFAADTFFILSGCLLTYNFLRAKCKELRKNPKGPLFSFKFITWFYIHRFFRIAPCFYVVLLSYTVLMPYFLNGPQWENTEVGIQQCRDRWWSSALFFSNFFKADDMCMGWSYYLVIDMQFYILSPLVLFPLLYFPYIGMLMLVMLVAVQIVSTAFLVPGVHGNLVRMDSLFFATVYVKPYCRVGVFAVGMGLGYLLHSTQRLVAFKKTSLLLGWTLSLAVVGTVVYIIQTESKGWTALQIAMYEAFSRPLWALAVAFIIYACSIGQGGFINELLSWNVFLPLCRITYGVYLLHPVLIKLVLNGSRYPFYFDFSSLVCLFVSSVVCASGLAFFLITLVESPFTRLEAVLQKRFA